MICKTFFSRVHKVPYGRPVRTSVILLPYPPDMQGKSPGAVGDRPGVC